MKIPYCHCRSTTKSCGKRHGKERLKKKALRRPRKNRHRRCRCEILQQTVPRTGSDNMEGPNADGGQSCMTNIQLCLQASKLAVECGRSSSARYDHRRNLWGILGVCVPPHFLEWGYVPSLFGHMTAYDRKNNGDLLSPSAHVSPQSPIISRKTFGGWGFAQKRSRGSSPLQTVLFEQSNKRNLGNWSLMFASISGHMALASSFSSHSDFGPHLPLLFKLH